MAYTFCQNCGQRMDDGERSCPRCGRANMGGANGYQPNGGYYGQPNGGLYNTGYGNWQQQQPRERKLSVGMLVFSLINIFVIGSPLFGILALIQTISARNQPTDMLEAEKLRYAKIFNIVGLVISVVVIVLSMVLFILMMESGYYAEYIFQ